VSALACLLLAALSPAEADEFVISKGEMEARLRLTVPEEGVAPGRARARIDIAVSGPPGLEIDGPRLEDAVAGWRAARRTSSWRREGEQAHMDIGLNLEQTKPGVVALPGIRLRARDGPAGDWEEFAWPDLLHEPRDVAPPVKPNDFPPSPWPGRLRWLALVAAVALTLAFVAWKARRWRPAPPEQPAHLRALARLEGGSLSPAEHLARIDQVVREYLDERFGLSTRRKTVAETLAVCANLPDPARMALAQLLRRVEVAKFAGVAVSEEDRREGIDLARQIIESCATLPAAQATVGEEKGESGRGG
jgi:hypothetical protein